MSAVAPGGLLRHQLGALAATAVDFGTMTLLVSLLGVGAAAATACGAALGGLTNFILGRRWIFQASGPLGPQAARYAAVSLGSLLLNTAGEGALVRLGLHFFAARVLVAAAVSIFWNYPLQRRVVFGGSR